MSLIMGGIMLTGLAAAQSMSSQAASPLAPGTFRLTVTEHEVSLEAHEASVAAIVADIGQHTGIPVIVYPGVDARITTHLSRVPLNEALKRLAPNIVILPAQGANAPPHRIAKVYVLAVGHERSIQDDRSPTQPRTPGPPNAQGHDRPPVATRPAPFQFTFDPSQHIQRSP